MNILDEIVSFVSPEAGFKRARYREAEKIRKYDGGSKGRRTKGWDAQPTSANTEVKKDGNTLRDRARDMVRNNAFARSIIDVIAVNTIGTGIRATVKVNGVGDPKIQKEWNDWADSTYCDYDGRGNFYYIQELVMRAVAESGQCLLLRKRSRDVTKIPLQVQVLESDYLYPYNDSIDGNKIQKRNKDNVIIHGVEFDSKGKRVGYWLYKSHPGDIQGLDLEPMFVPAKDIIHVFKVDRPGQITGVTFLAPVLILLKDLQDYQDAELTKQKVAACFTVFVTEPFTDPIDQNGKNSQDNLERVEPGIIEHLGPGKTINFAQPPSTSGYEAYTRRLQQQIACGVGITYESLTSDMSNVNFTSGRMNWLEMHRKIQSWRYNLIVPTVCEGVFAWVLEAGELGGQIKQKATAEWTAPRREMIDPVKEIKGINLAIRSGLTSWQEAVRENGYDPATNIKQIIEDYKDFDDNKITLDIDVRKDLLPPKEVIK